MFPTLPPVDYNNCSVPYFYSINEELPLRYVVAVTCFLSIIGSLLIILSYLLFSDLRTNARLILLHLSLSDFGVAFSNLFGALYHFADYFHCTPDRPDLPLLTPESKNQLCIAQAFFAHFSTISSVLWTMMLAAYMYTVITKIKEGPKSSAWFLRFSYVFCYGMSLIVNIWMVSTGKLGFSPFDTSGWCGTIITNAHIEANHHHRDYIAAIIGYDLWILLTTVFIVAIYISLHFYVRKERKLSSTFQELIYNIDYKFIAIPVAFVMLRIWSLLSNILFFYLRHEFPGGSFHKWLHRVFKYLAGIGDSGQGAVNAIIFVMFTRSVRQRIWSICCWCYRRKQQAEETALLKNDNEASDDSFSDFHNSSSPMHINQSPIVPKQKNNMGSMATTTSLSDSVRTFSSYETP